MPAEINYDSRCCMCLEDFDSSEHIQVRVLPCPTCTDMCKDCILQWLTPRTAGRRLCPKDRTPVTGLQHVSTGAAIPLPPAPAVPGFDADAEFDPDAEFAPDAEFGSDEWGYDDSLSPADQARPPALEEIVAESFERANSAFFQTWYYMERGEFVRARYLSVDWVRCYNTANRQFNWLLHMLRHEGRHDDAREFTTGNMAHRYRRRLDSPAWPVDHTVLAVYEHWLYADANHFVWHDHGYTPAVAWRLWKGRYEELGGHALRFHPQSRMFPRNQELLAGVVPPWTVEDWVRTLVGHSALPPQEDIERGVHAADD